jgi:hypothetical protein
LNYFNYFTEIEDAFVRRRQKHLHLSPMDWALIESWKEMNIPLHVALRGIEKAFDSWESKPRKRSVNSLLYCQEEVEAQYAEWLEARVGASVEAAQPGIEESAQTDHEKDLPFSRGAIVEHLERARLDLIAAREGRDGEFAEVLERAAILLNSLEQDFRDSAAPDAQKLETSLTGLERMLNECLLSVAPAEKVETFQAEIKHQLKPYRSHMEKPVYQQTFDNLLLKRLREHFAVPRLSLFYL